MKGMVFTEFIELVEQTWGLEMADDIIESSEVESGGSYTAVGSYPHTEMVSLVSKLHERTGIPLPELLVTFGRYLFGRLAASYPHLLNGISEPLDMMENIEGLIHVEVKRLYPDARPPMFSCRRLQPNQIEMVYKSHRSFGHVAEGLMLGCGDYFGKTIIVERKSTNEDGTEVTFVVTQQ